jgi:hypothetical protein
MRRVSLILAITFALAGLGGAEAQQSPSPTPKPGEITVNGKRPDGKDAIKTVIAPFVNAHAAPDRVSGLVLRQPNTGICPVTIGLSSAFNDFVTRRIIEVARQVGAVVQEPGRCRHNVQVVFTTEPQKLLDAVAKRDFGALLGAHFVGETKALAQVSRPIQAWYVTGTVSDTGPYPVMRFDSDGLALPEGQVEPDDVYGGTPYSGLGSHVPPKNNSQFMNALIVVDLNKVGGREIGPISDYVAMLVLSQAPSLDACSPLPSILDLMASGCQDRPAPKTLTEGDIAFLKALYAPSITTGAGARGRIEQAMARTLAPAATSETKPH